ncbi:MAG: YraN family protein [Gemmatimonadota bacterium]|nr:YraN family protein [Gemmatimonadota bacterium]
MAPESTYPPHRLGRRGEALAAHLFAARGWRVLARNYRAGRREVDIVVRQGRLLVFVEVKTRTGRGFGGPQAAVTRLKRREIEAVALDYLTRHVRWDAEVRFDVVAIRFDASGRVGRVEHIEDAWRPGWT